LVEIKPLASAINCPTLTLSPLCTTGLDGAPRFWPKGTIACFGIGTISIGRLALSDPVSLSMLMATSGKNKLTGLMTW